MEITPIQKVTSDNFKAHILSLKNELKTVSEELDSKMRLKEIYSNELEDISNKLKNKTEDLFIASKQLDEIKLREIQLIEKENKIKELEISTNKYVENEKNKLNIILIDNEIKIINQNNEINNLNSSIVDIKNGIDKLEIIKNNLSNDIKSINDNKNNIISEIDLLRIKHNDEIVKNNKIINDINKEIEILKHQLEIAREKISKPVESFEAEKIEFAKEYRNFIIRKKRLEKFIKQYFPNQVLKI